MGRPSATALAVAQAALYAARAHGDQVRKGTDVPYLSHLLGVAAATMDVGGTPDQCRAAVLHDVVEDAGGRDRLEGVRATFGPSVADMVGALSDAAPATGEVKPPWEDRKRAHLDHLADMVEQDHPAVLVSACDKLHNAEAIVADATDPDGEPGLAVFDRFSATPQQTAWYYRSLAEVLGGADLPGRLHQRLRTAAGRVAELAEEAAGGAQ